MFDPVAFSDEATPGQKIVTDAMPSQTPLTRTCRRFEIREGQAHRWRVSNRAALSWRLRSPSEIHTSIPSWFKTITYWSVPKHILTTRITSSYPLQRLSRVVFILACQLCCSCLQLVQNLINVGLVYARASLQPRPELLRWFTVFFKHNFKLATCCIINYVTCWSGCPSYLDAGIQYADFSLEIVEISSPASWRAILHLDSSGKTEQSPKEQSVHNKSVYYDMPAIVKIWGCATPPKFLWILIFLIRFRVYASTDGFRSTRRSYAAGDPSSATGWWNPRHLTIGWSEIEDLVTESCHKSQVRFP